MLQLILFTALLSNTYAKQVQHSSMARSRYEGILSDIKLEPIMVINSSLTINKSSESCPGNVKISLSNQSAMHMIGKSEAEYRQGTNQYSGKVNNAPKTSTKSYLMVNDLKNAFFSKACRIVHSLQRWTSSNKLLLLVISGTMLLITSTIALDCSIYFAAMARRHIMNIEDSLQEFRKDIAATANFKRRIRAVAEKKKNLRLPLAVANLNRSPKVKNKPKVAHGN